MTITTKAIITTAPQPGPPPQPSWSLQQVKVRDPKDDEVIVRILASGICHTDLVMSMAPPEMAPYPRVLGHEGSGIVESVGSSISHVKPDDHVLLSFDYCGKDDECWNCSAETPGYCPEFLPRNIVGEPGVFEIADGQGKGEKAAGGFFGQSSFAGYAVVKEKSVVNVTGLVKSEEELKLFAPFGCGFQTGAGSVIELANVSSKDTVVVNGLGGVGMLALMAAKIRGAQKIVGVDRVKSRLEIAKEVGATHVIDTSGFQDLEEDLAKAVQETLQAGPTVNIDTTGLLAIVKSGFKTLQNGGQLVLIGIMQGQTLNIDLGDFLASGKSVRACIEGNAKPEKFIPQMIQWYRDGKLPIERLIKFFPIEDLETALGQMHTGAAIKPILTW